MASIWFVAKAALFQAYTAAVQLLPSDLREKFVLIGGTSMLVLGGDRNTDDVDIVATPESLNAFAEAATTDPRFSQDAVSTWYYACDGPDTRGILVQLEFWLWVAGMPLLFAQPGPLWKDLRDLRFVLEKMEESDESFADVEMEAEDLEILRDGVAELGRRYASLLESLLRRRGTRQGPD